MTEKHFEERLSKLQGNMLNFAYVLTSDRRAAYDLVHDTTLKALSENVEGVDESSVKRFIYGLMRRLYNERRHSEVPPVIVGDPSVTLYRATSFSFGGESTVEGCYSVKELSDAIGSMEERPRMVFSMHVVGYTSRDIARRLRQSHGNILAAIFTARAALRNIFR